MNRFLDRYCRLLEWCIGIALAVMVVLVFGNVVLRYAFNSGITVSEEVSRWLFVWLTFGGATVALHERAHLGSDMLVSRLGPGGRKACLVLGQLLMLWISWLLFKGSWQQAAINWDVQAPVTGAPVAILYASGMVFAASSALMLLAGLWSVASGQVRDSELVMVRESEEQGELEAIQAAIAREDAAATAPARELAALGGK